MAPREDGAEDGSETTQTGERRGTSQSLGQWNEELVEQDRRQKATKERQARSSEAGTKQQEKSEIPKNLQEKEQHDNPLQRPVAVAPS